MYDNEGDKGDEIDKKMINQGWGGNQKLKGVWKVSPEPLQSILGTSSYMQNFCTTYTLHF